MPPNLKDLVVTRLLPRVQMPAQYVGDELGAVVKDAGRVRGRLCLAFPDAYTIGMSHHGLQVLYAVMNRRDDWACERVFTPSADMEQLLREHGVALWSLETFTPVAQFDVLGFTLQYELGYTNVLTMLDLAGIPLVAEERTREHPLVIAGGPCTANPEPMARFIDLFVLGDGEQSLPQVCDLWLQLRRGGGDRETMLAEMAMRLPYVYVPRFYEPQGDRGFPVPVWPGVPTTIEPAIVADLDAEALPTALVVPHVECVHDRITIEIMRGCPGRCRFCQSTTLKRPLRIRSVETIVRAALESYRNTGYNEVSLLSLSTSDYPHLDELLRRLQDVFAPLGVNISVPSLRVGRAWRTLGGLLSTYRRSGLTLAPEAASDRMRRQIGKRITNEDLYEGCRKAFGNGFDRVKLYFMCGLPGEEEGDLDGIIEMSETISRLGREVRGRPASVVANVSNFVPKPQTPYQFNAMERREYFLEAREHLHRRKRLRSVQLKCHDVESSLLEGALARGDRRTGRAIELAWRSGARFDAWNDRLRAGLWWEAFGQAGIDLEETLHTPCPTDTPLPWDHMAIHQGRAYLEREQRQSAAQLAQTRT
ncbi:MAG: B12-binding domain-containing radical SAM protein [Planctomycetes bacterium RBG_13_63_9]|nr:MAG: B12-binding domain-containing radical SAM protein [Planctomycetes bacterium RBG_13_63_9]